MKLHSAICGIAIGLTASLASAQVFTINWSTINPGRSAQGGTFELYGVFGQPAAGLALSGGTFVVTGGFIVGSPTGTTCPADLDDDGNFDNGALPDGAVTIEDFIFFLNAFEAGSTSADIDGDGIDPPNPDGGVTIDDLIFFLLRFENGC